MTPTKLSALVLAGLIAVSATAASAATLGEQLASGRLSEAAFVQLIAGTGLSADEARQMTVTEVAEIKWLDD